MVMEENAGIVSEETGGEGSTSGAVSPPSEAPAPPRSLADKIVENAQKARAEKTKVETPKEVSRKEASPKEMTPAKVTKEGDASAGKAEKVSEAPVVPGTYTPKGTYVVKGKEKTFPEWAKALAKDEETEKYLKDQFERSDGFEVIKEHRDTLQKEVTSVKEDNQRLYGMLAMSRDAIQKGDLESHMQMWGITKEQVLKLAHTFVNRTPEQQRAIDEARAIEQEKRTWQEKAQMAQQEYEGYRVSQRETELNAVLSHPEAQPLIQLMAERTGNPNALKDEIIALGDRHYQMTRQDLDPVTLTRQIAKIVGYNPEAAQAPAPQEQGPMTTQVVQPRQKQVLPQMPSKGTVSPVAKKPTRFADLRKRGQEIAAMRE